FRPDLVFDNLYRDLCCTAWSIHGDPDPTLACSAVRDSFVDASACISPLRTSLKIRRDALMCFGTRWSDWPPLLSRFTNDPRTVAVIGTDLVYNNTSAEEVYEKFPGLARMACLLEKWPRLRFAMVLLKDGSYDSGALDRTIQNI
ncbi:hypothetical protein KXV92_009083, partial [Aspergillus fumigatus]